MDGVLLIDKPVGVTSAEVVRKLKPFFKGERIGHLGTLDPGASGLLPILLGEATKLASFIDMADKEYHGVVQLGVETDTLDQEGRVVKTAPVPKITDEMLAELQAKFTGELVQTVPLFSAVKRNGRPLYELARLGLSPEPPKRVVRIYQLGLRIIDESSIGFVLVCSRGTYARALARDLGYALGTVGYLKELRRVRTGGFSISQSIPLGEVLELLKRRELPNLIDLRQAMASFAEIIVDSKIAKRIANGDGRALCMVPLSSPMHQGLVKIIFGGRLLAVAEYGAHGPKLVRVFPRAIG